MLRALTMPARRTIHLGFARAVAATLTVALAACGGSRPSSTEQAPPSAAPSTVSAEAEAKEKVLSAYNGFVQTYIKNSRNADPQDPDLRKFIGDPLLGDVVYDLSQLNRGGLVRTGELGSAPAVASVDLASAVKTAKIEDCLDTSHWDTVNKATGKSAAVPNQSTRTKIVADATLYDDGRWLVTKSTAQPGVSC